jgi:hypothetical protein
MECSGIFGSTENSDRDTAIFRTAQACSREFFDVKCRVFNLRVKGGGL